VNSRKTNRMKDADRLQLKGWMSDNRGRITGKPVAEVMYQVKRELGIEVTHANVRNMAADMEPRLHLTHEWPMSVKAPIYPKPTAPIAPAEVMEEARGILALSARVEAQQEYQQSELKLRDDKAEAIATMIKELGLISARICNIADQLETL
jgi:hypothetical protein